MKFSVGDKVVLKDYIPKVDSNGIHFNEGMRFHGYSKIDRIIQSDGFRIYKMAFRSESYTDEMIGHFDGRSEEQDRLDAIEKKLDLILELFGVVEYEEG
jgi:hypothetical protein